MMVVLTLFNDADGLVFTDIQFTANISQEDLKNTLHSLVTAQILTKEPNTKQISATDVFSVNENFSSKTSRVKVPLKQYAE